MFLLVLLHLINNLSSANTYSRGAPDSSCTEKMLPRHGFDVQAGPPPVKIFTDTEEMTHEDYLRVTIRSQGSQSFKGFLVKAVEVLNTDTQSYASLSPMGTWYIPFSTVPDVQSNTTKYVACDGVHQRAVTHTDANKNQVSVVHLQWTPPYNYHGIIVVTATVVQNYSTYWTNIRSHPVSVSVGEVSPKHATEIKTEKTTTLNNSDHQNTSENRPLSDVNNLGLDSDYYHEFISVEQLYQDQSSSSSEQGSTEHIINNQIPIENLYNIVTENILVQNSSLYKERSPRFENQELYEKIEANYGAWENEAETISNKFKSISIMSSIYILLNVI